MAAPGDKHGRLRFPRQVAGGEDPLRGGRHNERPGVANEPLAREVKELSDRGYQVVRRVQLLAVRVAVLARVHLIYGVRRVPHLAGKLPQMHRMLRIRAPQEGGNQRLLRLRRAVRNVAPDLVERERPTRSHRVAGIFL